jgi:hypothetical protein
MRLDERMHAPYDMHIGIKGIPKQKGCMQMTQATFSAKEVAAQLGINPKRFRAFVRTLAKSDAPIISACGQGNRYGITKGDAAKLIAAYRKAHPSTQGDAS